MTRYVKKGGWGGHRGGAGRKTLSKLDRTHIVSRYRAEWEKHCDNADRLRPPKRIRANWDKLAKVPLRYRALVLSLADQEQLPKGLPVVVREVVEALKKNRTALDQTGRLRSRARPYAKRDRLLKRVASEESKRRGVPISWQQLRRWCRDYENLISR
jgi:hypothetical protein